MTFPLPSLFPLVTPLHSALASPAPRQLTAAVVCMVGALSLLPAGMASAADLFTAPPPNRFAESQPGVYSVQVDSAALAQAIPGDRLRLNLPGNSASYEVLLDSNRLGSGGGLTWVGHVAGFSNDYRVILTVAPNGAVLGQMRLPGEVAGMDRLDQLYRIEPARVVSAFAAGEVPMRTRHNDERIAPPETEEETQQTAFSRARLGALDQANSFAATTRVDLLVLYTPGLAARYSGGSAALIDHLVALANQAYIDSGVDMELYVAGKVLVNYPENTDNDPALDDLSYASHTALARIASWRTQYGADLVTMIRPYDSSAMRSCGLGYVNGYKQSSLNTKSVYSVVSYGRGVADSGGGYHYCDDYTLAHEVGHTMGAAHDRGNTSDSGRYAYSYGYGEADKFGTIMSYIDPVVGKFSNPKVFCNGLPCGISELASNAANNALTFNNTKGTIANFMPMAGAVVSLTGITLASASLRVGASTSITPVPSNATLPACSSSNASVASVSGSTLTANAAGSATITCGSATATVTVLASTTPTSTQGFGLRGSVDTASNGNPRLTLTLSPEGADIGKPAQIYLAATTVSNGKTSWFIHNGSGWQPFIGLLTTYSSRTLESSIGNIVALNGELSSTELRGAQVTLYLGYILQGASASSLKYGPAYYFQ